MWHVAAMVCANTLAGRAQTRQPGQRLTVDESEVNGAPHGYTLTNLHINSADSTWWFNFILPHTLTKSFCARKSHSRTYTCSALLINING